MLRHKILAVALGLCSFAAVATPYNDIYFFGDSLTDTGNVSTTYAALPHPPGAPAAIPGSPYEPGGRASNGSVYADILAAGLGLDATASTEGGNNYAYSGARTRYQSLGAPFKGILDQINTFVAQPGAANAGALYVLWGGANNLQDLIGGRTVDVFGNPIPGLAATIGDIASGITSLYNEGARNILVPNAPDLSLVPRVAERGAAAQAGAHNLSLLFNQNLALALSSLESSLGGLNIIEFDTASAFNEVITNAASYGFSNTTDRCYTGDDLTFTGGGSVCANPDDYLFWDGIHPTAHLHQIIGDNMLAAVVPEPSTLWLLVIAAAGLMVVGCRRV